MLEMNGSDGTAIVLDDSLNGFRQFRAVLFTSVLCNKYVCHPPLTLPFRPFESCLATNLKAGTRPQMIDLLDLLVIANKYCAIKIEQRALDLLVSATTAKKLARHDTSVIAKVLEVACLVRSQRLAEEPRAFLLETLWSQHADKELSLTLLGLGKRTSDNMLLGATYYSIMLHGRSWWSTCDAIDATDTTRLIEGMMRCAREWHVLHCTWAAKGFGCHSDCERKRQVLERSHRIQIDKEVEWYDILGKLAATMNSSQHDSYSYYACEASITETLKSTTARVKQEVLHYFLNPIS